MFSKLMRRRHDDKNYVVHSPEDIDGIRNVAGMTAEILEIICHAVRPGMTAFDLDQFAGKVINDHGGASAFYNYQGFPGQICISINDEVVHGIGRQERVIQIGDIVSIDCGVRQDGFIGDTAKTVSVGPLVGQVADLMSVTERSLMAGIDAAVGGNTVKDIGCAIEKMVSASGYGVVRDFVGHGCGRKLHEPPEVPNYPTRKSTELLRSGMILALEPMVNMGTHKVKIDDDGWTVRTLDGGWSAHFEHMILITNGKPEILTWPRNQ